MTDPALSGRTIMAALADPALGAAQVDWETWGEGERAFRVCLGRLLRQWSVEPPVDFGAFLDEPKALLLEQNLSRNVHWVRTFIAVKDEKLLGFDALLDNDTWPAGSTCIEAWPWPHAAPERPYALRQFIIMLP